MSELLAFRESPSVFSRRTLGVLAFGGVTAFVLGGCATVEKNTGSSIDTIPDEELLFPHYSVSELQNPEKMSEILGANIRIQGYLEMIDQDLEYFNQYGQSFAGDKSAVREDELLTYQLYENSDRSGDSIFVTQKKSYALPYGHSQYSEYKTKKPNIEQRWLLTGSLQIGQVEIGNNVGDVVEAPYVFMRGVYEITA